MRETARLRLRVFALVLVGAVLVAIGVALLLENTISQRSRSSHNQRLNTELTRVIGLERLTIDGETGLRGYVITARPEFLQPTKNALAALPQTIANLRQALRGNPADAAMGEQLIAATNRYFGGYVPTVESLVVQAPTRARSVHITQLGKDNVDAIRQMAVSLESGLNSQTRSSETAAHTSANDAVVEAIAVLVVLTVATLLLGGYLGRLAVQRESARQRSEATTRTLQRSILPARIPEIPRVDLAVRFQPADAQDLVGGDFYDVFGQRPGVWSIVLGDVCGKGAEAAAVSAMARWTLRSLTGSEVGPDAALHFLNDAMLRQDLGSRFITLADLELTVEPDHAVVRISCGGHPPPVFVPAEGDAREVDARGDLVGIWSSIRLHSEEFTLQPGDGLVLYTDGITDVGPERVAPPAEVLRDVTANADANALADALMAVADGQPTPRRDDIAVVALRFDGGVGSVEPRAAVPAAAAQG